MTSATYSQIAHPKGKNNLSAGWMFTVLFFQLFCKFECFQHKKCGSGGKEWIILLPERMMRCYKPEGGERAQRRLELFKLILARKTIHVDHKLPFTVAENLS